MDRLLSDEGQISEEHRGQAVMVASKRGLLNILSRLLENEATISEEHRIQAILNAIEARNNRLAMVHQLLDNASISDVSRGIAVRHATLRIPLHDSNDDAESMDLFNFLLNSGHISPEDRGRALFHAIGHPEMFHQLLNQGPIDDLHRATIAAVLGTQDNSLETLDLVLASGPISPQHLNESIPYVVSAGQVRNVWRMTRDGFNPIQRLLHCLSASIHQVLPILHGHGFVETVHAKQAASRGEIRNAWELSRIQYNLFQRLLLCISAGISRIAIRS